MLKTVFTEKAPKAIGPYSQGIKVQDFYFYQDSFLLIQTRMKFRLILGNKRFKF